LLDWVEISRTDVARGLLKALVAREELALSKSAILALRVPVGDDQTAMWDKVVEKTSAKALQDEQRAAIHELNTFVAEGFKLNADELTFIETECREDSFIKRIKPRYPGSVTRKQGFRTGLDASSRYGG
jgi:hypothetical protein